LRGARAVGAEVIGERTVVARWRMGDGATLTIAANLGPDRCRIQRPSGDLIFEIQENASSNSGQLPGRSTVAFLEAARD